MNIIRVLIKQIIHDKRYLFYLIYCFVIVYLAKKYLFTTSQERVIAELYIFTVIGITNLICLDIFDIEKRLRIEEIIYNQGRKSKAYLHYRNFGLCLLVNGIILLMYLIISIKSFGELTLSPINIAGAIIASTIIYFLDYYTEHLTFLTTLTRAIIRNFVIVAMLIITL